MKDRGKTAAIEHNNNNSKFPDFNYSVSSDMPCLKHPSSNSVGICPLCLKDRLVNLVCSECGEQRHSSCSCSDRNSSSVEVGSVGRVSILLENDKIIDQKQSNDKTEQVILLRSSSNCVEIKKNKNGFWKIKRLFKKKNPSGVDEKSDVGGGVGGVSRSRSLCSFRGDDVSDYRFSSAKISDVTAGLFLDSDEPRRSGFRGYLDAEINGKKSLVDDDDGFIDLKLDFSSSSSDFFSDKRLSNVSDHGYESMRSGSCRIASVNEFDKRIKSVSNGKGNKVWKWIFKPKNSAAGGRKSTSNRDENINLIANKS